MSNDNIIEDFAIPMSIANKFLAIYNIRFDICRECYGSGFIELGCLNYYVCQTCSGLGWFLLNIKELQDE